MSGNYPRQHMKIDDVCLEVASYMYNQMQGNSPTTITSGINDALDHWEKEGLGVNNDYNQPRAIRKVQSVIEMLTKMGVPRWYK